MWFITKVLVHTTLTVWLKLEQILAERSAGSLPQQGLMSLLVVGGVGVVVAAYETSKKDNEEKDCL